MARKIDRFRHDRCQTRMAEDEVEETWGYGEKISRNVAEGRDNEYNKRDAGLWGRQRISTEADMGEDEDDGSRDA